MLSSSTLHRLEHGHLRSERFEVARFPAAAEHVGIRDAAMTDLAGETARTGEGAPLQDDPRADAAPEVQPDERFGALRRAEKPLGDGSRLRDVGDDDLLAQRLLDVRLEGIVLPPEVRRQPAPAARLIHETGHAGSYRLHPRARDAARLEHAGDQLRQRGDGAIGIPKRRGLHHRTNRPAPVGHRHRGFLHAEFDPDVGRGIRVELEKPRRPPARAHRVGESQLADDVLSNEAVDDGGNRGLGEARTARELGTGDGLRVADQVEQNGPIHLPQRLMSDLSRARHLGRTRAPRSFVLPRMVGRGVLLHCPLL